MKTKSPLVSVFIVTYNSQEYILDALDSVKSQTYQNIELVVSDDCSSDKTLVKVRDWINSNKERFARVEIVEAPVNTGTSANYNRAVRACKGEWLKMLDGDDVLLPNCIEDNIDFVNQNPEAKIVFSNYVRFKGKIPTKISKGDMPSIAEAFFSSSQHDQTKLLLRGNFLQSQTCFIQATLLKDNPYNERYRLLEDYPMWILLSDKGTLFHYFDKVTALYRLVDSVSSRNDVLFPVNYVNIRKDYFYNGMMPLFWKYKSTEAYDYNKKYYIWCDFCIRYLRNKRNWLTICLYWISKIIIFKCLYFRMESQQCNV